MKYIHLAKLLFKDDEQYVSGVATSVEEACAPIKAGFEYVAGDFHDGGGIFRRSKDYIS